MLKCGQIITIGQTKEGRQQIIDKLDAKPPEVDSRVMLKVKADTGENGNVLPIRCLKQMYPKDLDPCDGLQQASVQLIAANGANMEHNGYIDIPLRLDNSEWVNARFYVCDMLGPAISSCELSEKLGILKVSKSKNISAVNTIPEYRAQNPKIDIIRNKETLKELYPKCF